MSRNHARLNRRRWAHLRRRILDRDGWRCQSCGRAGRLEVDHVIPIAAGGDPWDPGNLKAICRGCHVEKTRGEIGRPRNARERAWDSLIAALLQ